MLLTEFIGTPVFVGEKQRGIIQGVFLSPKSKAVKYLLCSLQTSAHPPITISVSAIEHIDNSGLFLKQMRSTLPKNALLFKKDCPVYNENGVYLGSACNLELFNLTATAIFTENTVFPATSILAVGDAVLLRPDEPYPIGQRIPAPARSLFFDLPQSSLLVNRSLLKTAVKNGTLIEFTLSLPPFQD